MEAGGEVMEVPEEAAADGPALQEDPPAEDGKQKKDKKEKKEKKEKKKDKKDKKDKKEKNEKEVSAALEHHEESLETHTPAESSPGRGVPGRPTRDTFTRAATRPVEPSPSSSRAAMYDEGDLEEDLAQELQHL